MLKSGPRLRKRWTLTPGTGAIWMDFPKKFASQDFCKSSELVEVPPNSLLRSTTHYPQVGWEYGAFSPTRQ